MLATHIRTICLQRSARRLCSVTRSRVPKVLQTGLEIVRKFASPKHGAARLLNTPELLTAADRMEAVTGISASLLEELNDSLAIDISCIPLRRDTAQLIDLFGGSTEIPGGLRTIQTQLANTVKSWADIDRGRDLFVPGLSSFDIPNAVNAVFECQVQGLLNEAKAQELHIWMSASVCIITPQTLRTYGHFPALRDREKSWHDHFLAAKTVLRSQGDLLIRRTRVGARSSTWEPSPLRRTNSRTVSRILMMDRESPLFKHFVRYAAWWGDPANANVLDELDRARELFESTHPRQGHQTEDDKTRWAQAWPVGGESMQPPTLLNRMRELERLRQLGPDVHYSLLDSLKDPTAEPSSTHVLRILRSKHTVAKVSKELNNCALSYATWVERGGYVLVAIFDVTGKAKALAGYRPGAESWDHEPVEKNNVSAPGEMCVLFDDYLSVLTAWSRQTYPDGLPDDDQDDEHDDDDYDFDYDDDDDDDENC